MPHNLAEQKWRANFRYLGIQREAAPQVESTLDERVQDAERRGEGGQQHQRVRIPAYNRWCVADPDHVGSGPFTPNLKAFQRIGSNSFPVFGELIGSWTKNINGQIIKSARKNVCNYSTRKFDFKQNESRIVKYEYTHKLGSIAEPDPTLRFP